MSLPAFIFLPDLFFHPIDHNPIPENNLMPVGIMRIVLLNRETYHHDAIIVGSSIIL